MLSEYDKPRTLVAGDSFNGGGQITFTVLADAVISDGEGNIIGSYVAGNSYQSNVPKSNFVVTSGSIKLW